jgi:hypothetical protein
MNEEEYYVYLHRFSNGTFYVGKGKQYRSTSKKRNAYWKNLQRKYGDPIIGTYRESLKEEDAFELEVALLRLFKEASIPVCNLTAGGEGLSGYKHTKASKEKISRALVGNKYSNPEILRKWNVNKTDTTLYTFYHPLHGVVEAYCKELATKYSLYLSGVHAVAKNRVKSTKGWTLKGASKQVRGKIYQFTNANTQQVVAGTYKDLEREYDISASSLHKLVKGKIKQTRQGWEFDKEVRND